MKDLYKYSVRVENYQEEKAAIEFYQKFTGLSFHSDGIDDGKNIGLSRTFNAIYCSSGLNPDGTLIPFNQIHTLLLDNPSVEITLNSKYKALVNDTNVQVGCQTIAFEPILKIAELIKQKQNEKS